MKSREEFINDLREPIKNLEKQVKHRTFYSVKNGIIKTGVRISFLLPAIISSFLVYNGFKNLNRTPFKLDKVSCSAKIISTDTSTKKHEEEIFFKHEVNFSPKFEYSTGWKLNKNNFYEREITVYCLNDDIEKIDFDEILKMPYEEIKQFFTVANKQTIKKAYLDEEDHFYDEDMFIITHLVIDENNTKMLNETKSANFINSLQYTCISMGLFWINNSIFRKRKIYIKIMNNIDEKYKLIEAKDIEELKKILEIRKENMELFDEPKKYVLK